MANNISPGVYTKIIDLSSYVQTVPSSIGFLCALSKKGRDNQMVFLASRSDLVKEFGEPNILTYGQTWGQGLYEAYNFLGEANAMYFMRCMPYDAAYANLLIYAEVVTGESDAAIGVQWVADRRTRNDLNSSLEQVGPTLPLAIIYPMGRGDYYNQIGIRLTPYANQMVTGIYNLDIYEKQSDGDEVIVESFSVSFEPTAVDDSGDSIWIVYVLNTYSNILKCDMTVGDEPTSPYTSGYDLLIKAYAQNMGNVSVVPNDSTSYSPMLIDDKQNFYNWQTPDLAAECSYVVVAKDSFGNTVYGWLGESSDLDNNTVNIYDSRLTSRSPGWFWDNPGETPAFRWTDPFITYSVKKAKVLVSDCPEFESEIPVPLKKGSDGSLVDNQGQFVSSIGSLTLAKGYVGQLISPILSPTSDPDAVTVIYENSMYDTDNVYFNLVFDAGYETSVKTAIHDLVVEREDCIAILDNGSNKTCSDSLVERKNHHTYNTMYCALYEEYNQIYDTFTGKEIWVSPVYHMSYLIPRNDFVAEIWYAVAGFNRASIASIRNLRYNPKQGERDQLYLAQLNPIVKFAPGYVVWGNLTTQTKPSALQDINIVRLVLYVKRALEQYCRYYIFEMNDSTTWNQIKADCTSFLELIKSKRGLYSYTVDVGATPYEIKTKTIHVNIVLQPTRVVEKIDINLFIK